MATALSTSARAKGVCRFEQRLRHARTVCHAAIEVPSWVKEVKPRGQHLYVKVQDKEAQTTGGVLLPEAAQSRPTSGRVVSVGDGAMGNGRNMTFSVKEGDEVLFSKFGFAFTELDVGGDEFLLMKEHDVIGVMPRANAIADDVPELRPIGDRVLVRVDDVAEVTSAGLVLPESARDKPVSGTVVRAGPGKTGEDGNPEKMAVSEGDTVVYFKYAGDNMETTDGTKYVVLHQQDVLCKM